MKRITEPFIMVGKHDETFIRQRAFEQGLHVAHWAWSQLEQVLSASMKDRPEEFIWSQRCAVWFIKGTNPEKALEELKERKRKDARANAFNLSYNGHKAKAAAVIMLKLRSDGPALKPLEWKQGPGPCGRNVWGLKVDRESMPGWLVIWQWCEDEPSRPDEFAYPLSDIANLKVYQTKDPNPSSKTCG